MRVYLMTDLEGVAGVEDSENWCLPTGAHYRRACELLTREVNAAVRGFLRAGADRVRVVDGHGWGGIARDYLHPAAEYFRRRGPNPYPFGNDDGFDAIAWVGQHAKAGALRAHLPHTGSFNVVDYRIDDVSVGEFAQIAMCARLYGVRPILASGDQALVDEARALFPDIHAVAVKQGLNAETGADRRTPDEYSRANIEAEHLSPDVACERLEHAAYQALSRSTPLSADDPLGAQESSPRRRILTLRKTATASNVDITAEYPDLLTLLNDHIE